MAIRLGIDMGLFDAVARLCGGNFKGGKVTAQQLAEATHVDPLLVRTYCPMIIYETRKICLTFGIVRVIRHLAAMNVFKDLGNKTFAPTPFAAVFVSDNPMSAGIICMCVSLDLPYPIGRYCSPPGYHI